PGESTAGSWRVLRRRGVVRQRPARIPGDWRGGTNAGCRTEHPGGAARILLAYVVRRRHLSRPTLVMARVEDLLWAAVEPSLYITREQYFAGLVGWKLTPHVVDGEVVAIALTKGPEF